MPPYLYVDITAYTEAAFRHDFNLIIESYDDFYHQLTPKDQTLLIKTLFPNFRRNFRPFFDPCEQGFVNEVIIQLATRRWKKGIMEEMIHRHGIKVEEMFFLV